MKPVRPNNAILILLLFVSINAFSQKKSKDNDTTRRLFKYHLNKLDSAAKKSNSDTVTCCSFSIAFMVEHTDVRVQAEGTTFGFLFFTKSELKEWHKWYNKKYEQNSK